MSKSKKLRELNHENQLLSNSLTETKQALLVCLQEKKRLEKPVKELNEREPSF